ncbi:MAG: DoxX family membrane protein [Candidatus Paceibacterota bacterium]
MNIPSVFPFLLAYEQVAPLILRVVLGVTLAYFGYQKIRGDGSSSGSNSKIYGWVELLIAIFLVIGLWTQVAAMLNAVILLIKIGFKIRHKAFLTDGINYYLLLLAIAISLMLTGAGIFAFDIAV